MLKLIMKSKILKFGVAFLLFLTNTPLTSAQEESGDVTITFISGEVLVLKKGETQWQPANAGDILSGGDTIKTSPDGKAKLQFPSGSTMVLNENTSLVIEQLAAKTPAAAKEGVEVFLIGGRIKATVEKLEKETKFEIKTPTAIAGVRGTVFYLNVVKESERMMTSMPAEADKGTLFYAFLDRLLGIKNCYAAANGLVTEIFVEKGIVDFTNLISRISYRVGEEQGSFADEEGRMPEPKYVPADKQKEWKAGFELPSAKKKKEEKGKDKKGEKKKTSPARRAEASAVDRPAPGADALPGPGDPGVDLPPPPGGEGNDIEGREAREDNNRAPGVINTPVNIGVDTYEQRIREELVDLHNDIAEAKDRIELAELDNRLTQIQDAQEGKVMHDREGYLVRSESYVLRPTDNKVGILFLSDRVNGPNAGVSSVAFEVTFNTSLANVNLKRLPWADIMSSNTHDDPIKYTSSGPSMPDYFVQPNSANFDPTDEDAGMVLTVRNPHGDYNRIYDGFGPPVSTGAGWQQAHVEPLFNMNINGNLKQIGYGTGWVPSGGTGSYEQNFGGGVFYRATGYVIDDNGAVQSADTFAGGGSQPLQINSVRDILKPNRENNLEFLIEATEFDGRSIDVIVAPEIMAPYHSED